MLFDQKRLVLVVDDEESLLKLNGRILEKAGYSVLLASSSHQALTMFQRHSDQIHLLFSGVEMPVMNGIALANQITAERPGIAVLLTSANPSYAEETRFSFLAQPYNPEKLQMAAAQTLEMHAESGAAVELKAGPVFVTEDSSSRPEIGTPHRQSVETNAFVRQELPPEMAKYYREGRRHLSNVVPEPEPMLPETVVLIRKDHRHSPDIDSSAVGTAARSPAIGVRERLSRWGLPHTVPLWASVAAALVLVIAPFGLHQFNERRSAYGVSLQAVRGLAGEVEAPAGTPLLLNLDVTSLPRSTSYKIKMVNSDGYNLWQKIIAAEGSEVHTKSASLRPGIYFVRVYGPTGELLKEYELRVSQKH